MTTNILMTLTWLVTTNWQPAGDSSTLLWPSDANRIAYFEYGQVRSNLIGNLEWEGRTIAVQLDSVLFAECRRSYTTKVVREYADTIIAPIEIWRPTETNFLHNLGIRLTNWWIIDSNHILHLTP